MEIRAVYLYNAFLTDYASSRLGSYFWTRGERRRFFITIGADQALHLTALLLGYEEFIQ